MLSPLGGHDLKSMERARKDGWTPPCPPSCPPGCPPPISSSQPLSADVMVQGRRSDPPVSSSYKPRGAHYRRLGAVELGCSVGAPQVPSRAARRLVCCG